MWCVCVAHAKASTTPHHTAAGADGARCRHPSSSDGSVTRGPTDRRTVSVGPVSRNTVQSITGVRCSKDSTCRMVPVRRLRHPGSGRSADRRPLAVTAAWREGSGVDSEHRENFYQKTDVLK